MLMPGRQCRSFLSTSLVLICAALGLTGTAAGADDAGSSAEARPDKIAPLAGTADLLPDDAEVSSYLPRGKVRAVFYHLTTPPELGPLVQKFKAATTRNAAWLKQYRSQHSGTLPYHRNFGLTKAEYASFLRLSKETVYAPHSEGWIDFDWTGKIVTLKTIKEWKDLEGTEIHVYNNSVLLLGKVYLFQDGPLKVSATNKATGAWHGQRWKRTLEGDTPVDVEFTIGQHDESRDGILYYNRRIGQSPNHKNITFLIRYELDKPQ